MCFPVKAQGQLKVHMPQILQAAERSSRPQAEMVTIKQILANAFVGCTAQLQGVQLVSDHDAL